MAVIEHNRMGDRPLQLVRTMRFRSGVRGILYLPDGSGIHTLEDEPIPPGAYFMNPDETGKHRNWVIETVMGSRAITGGRVSLEIHAGNDLRDSKGCILPGLRSNRHGVADSISALNRMRDVLDRNDEDPRVWVLHISEAF